MRTIRRNQIGAHAQTVNNSFPWIRENMRENTTPRMTFRALNLKLIDVKYKKLTSYISK